MFFMLTKSGATCRMHHADTFGFIALAMTEKYNIPNPCISCHQHRPNQWATGWAKHWYPPWKAE
jgi:hypothetical protein